VHRPVEDVELLMRAEDLDFAPVITWWNNNNLWKDRAIPRELTRKFDGHRLHNLMAGEDEREGGALLYFGLDRPLDIAGSKREVPSPMMFVTEARRRNSKVWIDIEKPFWWDVPVLPSPRGNGFWTQEIYYHMLNSGLRVPPSAGSASGVLPNPVGYNRVYLYLDKPLTDDAWFESLSRGRCFVTNGPLLLVKANDKFPGATFKAAGDKGLEISLDVQLTSNDRVSRIELIHNGKVTKTVDASDKLSQQQLLKFTVDGPGWFLVLVVSDVEETFRFASTAPWFVETEQTQHRISRQSAQFFLDWVEERIARVRKNVESEAERREVLVWHERARAFWSERVRMASAE
jgi:hypothetical protein